MDELAALAIARQHDLGVGALCARLSRRVSCHVLSPMLKFTGGAHPGGQVRHELAPGRVATREKAEDVGGVVHALDGQVARADDGREIVHHQGADIAGGADVAALCCSPSVCSMLDDCYEY